jgi:hypothetical protein
MRQLTKPWTFRSNTIRWNRAGKMMSLLIDEIDRIPALPLGLACEGRNRNS